MHSEYQGMTDIILLLQDMHVRVLRIRVRVLTLRVILTSAFACTPAIMFS